MNDVEIIHAITEPNRFRILSLLMEHTYCVKALSKKLEISESAVSQHLRVLKKYEVVTGTKIGYQTHYTVDNNKVHEILGNLQRQFFPFADTPLQRSYMDDCTCEFISECIKRDPIGAKEELKRSR